MGNHGPGFEVRLLREQEVDEVIRVWHASKQVAYPYLPTEQGLTLADNTRLFHQIILPRNQVWVACGEQGVAGFLGIDGDYIDRLYVHPDRQGQGAGSALMQQAQQLSPAGLRLHTHQQNHQARAFYERRGFRAVKFGISPPPESAPDVEYHWTPPSTAPEG